MRKQTQFYLNVFSSNPPPQAELLTEKQERFLVRLIHVAGKAAFQSAKTACLVHPSTTLLKLTKDEAVRVISHLVENAAEPGTRNTGSDKTNGEN